MEKKVYIATSEKNESKVHYIRVIDVWKIPFYFFKMALYAPTLTILEQRGDRPLDFEVPHVQANPGFLGINQILIVTQKVAGKAEDDDPQRVNLDSTVV